MLNSQHEVLYRHDGHHPAEITTTLAGARLSFPERRVVAVFQHHRYSRVRDLQHEFAQAFNDADEVFVTDIYAAGEAPLTGIGGACIAAAIRRHGHKGMRFTGSLDDTLAALRDTVSVGDSVRVRVRVRSGRNGPRKRWAGLILLTSGRDVGRVRPCPPGQAAKLRAP